MNSKLIIFLKRILISNRKSKLVANSFVRKYYKNNRRRGLKFIKNVWSKNIYWDFFLQSLPNSVPSKYYVPRDFYAINLETKFKNNRFAELAIEKNYYDKLFAGHGVLLPKTFFRIIDGIYFDRDFNIVTNLDELIINVKQDIIIKSTLGSEGSSVIKYFYHNNKLINNKGNGLNFPEVIVKLGNNLIVQEVVKQHPGLEMFHPSSLNTIRAFSYRSIKTNEVHVVIAMLRMGIGGSFIDNASVDGIAAGINLENGTLKKYAFNKYGDYFEKHPDTNISFENFPIPCFNEIISTVKNLANILAHNRLIGWDISISPQGDPILIEPNTGTGTWMLQIANGRPLFGPYSEEVWKFMKE